MKFGAKVKLGEKDAGYLIHAFFEEFNPKSSIVIKGNEAKVEIIFNDSPPMELIKSIMYCDVTEFYFGQVLGEYSKAEPSEEAEPAEEEGEESPSEEAESVEKEEETSKQVDKPKSRRGRPKAVNPETINIPELEEIAKNATSFEHFVKLVAKWLEMGRRQVFFENLANVSTEVYTISWKELEKALENKGVGYIRQDKIWTVKHVSERIEKYGVTMLPFLGAIALYKDYSFGKETSDVTSASNVTEEGISQEKIMTEVEESNQEDVSGNTEAESNVSGQEEIADKAGEATHIKVKMECMPEIPYFEEVLGSIDKTQPIEDRVKHVLIAMGWDKKGVKEKQQIFEIVNTAVRIKEMDFQSVLMKVNISNEYKSVAWMNASEFINDYVKMHNGKVKIKLVDFLEELQEIVMNESEIEDFTD